jgi:hypothetical protein
MAAVAALMAWVTAWFWAATLDNSLWAASSAAFTGLWRGKRGGGSRGGGAEGKEGVGEVE